MQMSPAREAAGQRATPAAVRGLARDAAATRGRYNYDFNYELCEFDFL
mgnify:CR=1 FL=1